MVVEEGATLGKVKVVKGDGEGKKGSGVEGRGIRWCHGPLCRVPATKPKLQLLLALQAKRKRRYVCDSEGNFLQAGTMLFQLLPKAREVKVRMSSNGCNTKAVQM
ncbi:hypothetical protein VNO78_31051 [Psophocarpus tetragonolobus]|uniref:Uncharacterized protein n=1 Tax=Psophocarpus tetragonolobus TaxID=3891 RepID=A0AAN9X6V0_PSOTE